MPMQMEMIENTIEQNINMNFFARYCKLYFLLLKVIVAAFI